MEATTVLTVFDPPPPPADKEIELTVAWYIRDYKVLAISNTTALKPGMWLAPGVVEECARAPKWTVNVVDNQLVTHVFDLISGVKGATGR